MSKRIINLHLLILYTALIFSYFSLAAAFQIQIHGPHISFCTERSRRKPISISTSTSTRTSNSAMNANKAGVVPLHHVPNPPDTDHNKLPKKKTLILIRHGSSHANEYMDQEGNRWGDETFTDDATLVDSGLSSKGVEQARSLLRDLQELESGEDKNADSMHRRCCEELKESLDLHLAASISGNDNGGVLIVTSPLTRAIETMSIGVLPYLDNRWNGKDEDCCIHSDCCDTSMNTRSSSDIIKQGKKAIAQPLASERVYTASDTGRTLNDLEQEFPFVDFNGCTNSSPYTSSNKDGDENENDNVNVDAQSQTWWFTHNQQKHGPYHEWRPNDGQQYYAVPGEPVKAFQKRMVKFYQWIESRNEEVIVLVTHWAVIRFFTGQEDVENCGVRVVDFEKVVLKDDLVSAYVEA